MSANCFELVRRACSAPDRTLIESNGRRFSCRDTLLMTGRLANILVLSGVEPDDRVLVDAEPTPEHVLLLLAVLRAGGVYVSVGRIDSLAAVEAKVVVCPSLLREKLLATAEKHAVASVHTLDANGSGTLMDGAAKAPSEFADVPRDENDLAAVFGKERAIEFTHGKLAARAKPIFDGARLVELVLFG